MRAARAAGRRPGPGVHPTAAARAGLRPRGHGRYRRHLRVLPPAQTRPRGHPHGARCRLPVGYTMRFRRGSTSAGPAADQVLLRRTGRVAALQAALALAVVLMLIGAVAFLFDIHVQNKEISGQLSAVVASADDVTDAPPGTALAIRAPSGNVAVSDHAPAATARLLNATPGYSDVRDGGSEYRALVADRDGTRVVALLDLTPWQTGRQRLLIALAAAEIAGVIG